MYAASNVVLRFPNGGKVTFHDPETKTKTNEIDLRPDDRLQYDNVTDIINAECGMPGSFTATIGSRVMHVRYTQNFLIRRDGCD